MIEKEDAAKKDDKDDVDQKKESEDSPPGDGAQAQEGMYTEESKGEQNAQEGPKPGGSKCNLNKHRRYRATRGSHWTLATRPRNGRVIQIPPKDNPNGRHLRQSATKGNVTIQTPWITSFKPSRIPRPRTPLSITEIEYAMTSRWPV